MDSVVPGYLNDLSCCSGWQDSLLPLTEIPASHPSEFGYSVQILNMFDYERIDRKETYQATPDSLYSLDDYLIGHLPAVDKFLPIPDSIPPIQSEQFIPDCAFVPEYLTVPACTDSTSTDNRQMSRPLLCSTATVEQLNKDTQQQVPTETATLTATKSFGSPTPPVLEGGQALGIGNSSQTKLLTSPRCKMAKGRGGRANYLSTDKRKMAQARRQAKYCTSVNGRMSRVISNARYHAYSKAKRGGFSEGFAREKGEAAAKERQRRFIIEFQQSFQSHSR